MRSLWRFLAYSRPYWKLLSVALVASVLRMAMTTYFPIYAGDLTRYAEAAFIKKTLAPAEMWPRLVTATGIYLAVLIGHLIVTIGRVYLPQRASAAVVRDLRHGLYAHVQRLSLGFHAARPSGAIASRVITDVQSAQQAVELGVIITCQAVLQIAAIATIMLVMNWQWALVSFTVMPLFLLSTRVLSRPMRIASRRVLESTEQMSGHVHERFGMIREVQSFGAEGEEQEQVWHHTERLRTHSVRHGLFSGILTASGEGTTFLGLAAVLVFGVYAVSKGEADTGDIMTFLLFTGRLFTPVQWLTGAYGQIQTAVSATQRIFEFMDTEPKIQDSPDATALALDAAPRVRFDGVNFSYPVDKPQIVLKELSFDIAPGSRVALVGPSGGGKTTTLSLLPRFYDVQGGRILIGNRDIREVTVRSLRKAIGIVPQEPVLFSGTIRQNILYGRQGASEDEMLEAARAANAHEFILDQESGYETVVGERGVGLSGGQIQRIAIARAFLKDPAILIMDEPTSNLDAVSESLILEAIDRLAEGRTTFVVAHRLSMARSADVILVMDDGRLLEMGRHDDLIAAGGVYCDLWRRQVGDVGPN